MSAAGQITRNYELVIAESGSDLSVEVTIDQTGGVKYEYETDPWRGDSTSLDRSISYSAGGTYGPPTLVVTDVSYGDLDNRRENRWKFEVGGGAATGALNIGTNRGPSFWESAIRDQGEAVPITLEKQ